MFNVCVNQRSRSSATDGHHLEIFRRVNDLALIGTRHEEDQGRVATSWKTMGDIGFGACAARDKNLPLLDRDGRADAFVHQPEPGGEIVLFQPLAKGREAGCAVNSSIFGRTNRIVLRTVVSLVLIH